MKKTLMGLFLILSVFLITAEDAADRMVYVKGGNYKNPRGTGKDKRIKLADFYVSAVQVTVGDYQAYLRETDTTSKYLDMEWLGSDYEHPITVDIPMGYISWFDAVEYCNWLSKKRGYRPVYEICAEKAKGNSYGDWVTYPEDAVVKWDPEADGYRLLSVTEWEYAASARGKNFDYGSINSPTVLEEAWLYENANFEVHPVGLKKPNALGLYDMMGNMYEWCWDLAETNNEEKKYHRVTKGSEFNTRANASHMLNRFSLWPLRVRYPTHGFRLARSVVQPFSQAAQKTSAGRYSAGSVHYASDNLNIRSEPNLQAQKVGLIPKGQSLTLIETGQAAHIDGITAPWVRVRLQDGTEGWCFSGYIAARKP